MSMLESIFNIIYSTLNSSGRKMAATSRYSDDKDWLDLAGFLMLVQPAHTNTLLATNNLEVSPRLHRIKWKFLKRLLSKFIHLGWRLAPYGFVMFCGWS